MDAAAPAAPRTVRRQTSILVHARDLLNYRDLIVNLTARDLKVRYKNSALGFLWSFLNPLGMMLVFTVVFTIMMPNNQVEQFPIFLLCGLLPWNFFSASVMGGISSIVANGELVKKVYFPREALPIATSLGNMVNFLLALLVLFAAVIIFRARISPWLWMLPIVILIQLCFVLGISLILSTLNVFYRDTIMVMDVVMLAWFFLTPVFYPIDILPRSYEIAGITLDIRRLMYILNPMASLISTYRDLLYWGWYTNIYFFIRTAITSLGVLVVGYGFFVRYSGRFGEEV